MDSEEKTSEEESESKPEPTPQLLTEETPDKTPMPVLRGETQNKKGRRPFLKIFLALLILALLGAGAAFFFSNRANAPVVEDNKEATGSTQVKNDEEAENYELGYVKSDLGLNLRQEPSTVSSIVQTLPNNTTLKIISQEGDWYFVEATTRGYVSKQYVTKSKPSKPLIVYSAPENLNFKFIMPEGYDVKADETGSFNFSDGTSSGGFIVTQESTGQTIQGYVFEKHPGAKPLPCDITIGNARECKMFKIEDETFYLTDTGSSLLKFTILAAQGNFPSDLTAIIFPTFYFGS